MHFSRFPRLTLVCPGINRVNGRSRKIAKNRVPSFSASAREIIQSEKEKRYDSNMDGSLFFRSARYGKILQRHAINVPRKLEYVWRSDAGWSKEEKRYVSLMNDDKSLYPKNRRLMS